MSDNVSDWFKDLVGIIDDAQDVSDAAEKEIAQTAGTVKTIAKQSRSFADQLTAAAESNWEQDPKLMVKIIRVIDGHAPLLWRKCVKLNSRFTAAFTELDRLEGIVKRDFPPSEGQAAMRHIREARAKIGEAQKTNVEAIKVYSKIQATYNRHISNWRKISVAVVAVDLLAGGVASTIAGIVKGAQEGRILINLINQWFVAVTAIWRSLGWVIKKLGQGAATAIRGGHQVMVRTAQVMGARQRFAPAPA